jgi:phosphatidylglycerophosphatase A
VSVARRIVLSAFGVGLLPGPRGTYGSAATVAAIVLAHGRSAPPLATATVACFAFGVLATLLLANFRAEGGGSHADPSWVVTDEVAGQALALSLAGIPGRGGWIAVAAAFVLFRVLDVTKPGPIRSLERLPAGAGVLADDLAAGAVAGALVAAGALLLG